MALIFDRFTTIELTEAFAAAVRRRFSLCALTFNDQEAMDAAADAARRRPGLPAIDHFPFRLDPFIACVDQPYSADYVEKEDEIIALVDEFGGEFAGT
jgi:hypothetical protein